MIQNTDLDKIFSLLKWIEPRSSESFQTWIKDREIMSNHVYKIEKFGKTKMAFFQIEYLTEINFKKIYNFFKNKHWNNLFLVRGIEIFSWI